MLQVALLLSYLFEHHILDNVDGRELTTPWHWDRIRWEERGFLSPAFPWALAWLCRFPMVSISGLAFAAVPVLCIGLLPV